MDLIDMHRTFQPATPEDTFCSKCTRAILQDRRYVRLQSRPKKINFFDHSSMKLEINNRKKTKEIIRNVWELNNTLQNNQGPKRNLKENNEVFSVK